MSAPNPVNDELSPECSPEKKLNAHTKIISQIPSKEIYLRQATQKLMSVTNANPMDSKGHVKPSQKQISKISSKLLAHVRNGKGFTIKPNFKISLHRKWM